MSVKPHNADTWVSPPELAKQLGVSAETVLHWIRNGELRAANLAKRNNGRPRWRISPEWLNEFLARRVSSPPATYSTSSYGHRPPRRRTQKPPSDHDGRLSKNIPHEVRVKRMAIHMAARKFGQGAEWRSFVPEAAARYAERTGVKVDESAIAEMKAWWEE